MKQNALLQRFVPENIEFGSIQRDDFIVYKIMKTTQFDSVY